MNEGTHPHGGIPIPPNRPMAMENPYSLDAQQPLPPKRNKPRPISIQPLDHGFNVQVGCQVFAVESVDALIHRLTVYMKNPDDTEQKWLSGEWKF